MVWNIFKSTLLKKIKCTGYDSIRHLSIGNLLRSGFFSQLGCAVAKNHAASMVGKTTVHFETPAHKHFKDKWYIKLLYK